MSSELENSGIRLAVGDCRVTEHLWWRQPYQTGKTVHVHEKDYKHNEDGRTAPGVCGNGSVPLDPLRECRYENWNTHTQVYNGLKWTPIEKGSKNVNGTVTSPVFKTVFQKKKTKKIFFFRQMNAILML